MFTCLLSLQQIKQSLNLTLTFKLSLKCVFSPFEAFHTCHPREECMKSSVGAVCLLPTTKTGGGEENNKNRGRQTLCLSSWVCLNIYDAFYSHTKTMLIAGMSLLSSQYFVPTPPAVCLRRPWGAGDSFHRGKSLQQQLSQAYTQFYIHSYTVCSLLRRQTVCRPSFESNSTPAERSD